MDSRAASAEHNQQSAREQWTHEQWAHELSPDDLSPGELSADFWNPGKYPVETSEDQQMARKNCNGAGVCAVAGSDQEEQEGGLVLAHGDDEGVQKERRVPAKKGKSAGKGEKSAGKETKKNAGKKKSKAGKNREAGKYNERKKEKGKYDEKESTKKKTMKMMKNYNIENPEEGQG